MLRGDPKRTEPLKIEFIIDRWADGIKLIGAGNSAGLFAAGVALYYFASRPFPVIRFLKTAAGTYSLGLVAFVIAYTYLHAYMHTVDFYLAGDREERWLKDINRTYLITGIWAAISLGIWLLGTILIMTAVFFL
jgi:hypothetical protein